jgi:hypothetical protein
VTVTAAAAAAVNSRRAPTDKRPDGDAASRSASWPGRGSPSDGRRCASCCGGGCLVSCGGRGPASGGCRAAAVARSRSAASGSDRFVPGWSAGRCAAAARAAAEVCTGCRPAWSSACRSLPSPTAAIPCPSASPPPEGTYPSADRITARRQHHCAASLLRRDLGQFPSAVNGNCPRSGGYVDGRHPFRVPAIGRWVSCSRGGRSGRWPAAPTGRTRPGRRTPARSGRRRSAACPASRRPA